MRTLVATVALAAAFTSAACSRTGEGEYQVRVPDLDVKGDTIIIGIDTATIRTPSVDVGTTKDTVVVDRPAVDVNDPRRR